MSGPSKAQKRPVPLLLLRILRRPIQPMSLTLPSLLQIRLKMLAVVDLLVALHCCFANCCLMLRLRLLRMLVDWSMRSRMMRVWKLLLLLMML
jgi:hypothetical protein